MVRLSREYGSLIEAVWFWVRETSSSGKCSLIYKKINFGNVRLESHNKLRRSILRINKYVILLYKAIFLNNKIYIFNKKWSKNY